jgi:hypothetical protein
MFKLQRSARDATCGAAVCRLQASEALHPPGTTGSVIMPWGTQRSDGGDRDRRRENHDAKGAMRGEDGLVESRRTNVTLRSQGTDSPPTVVGLSDCAEVQAGRAVATRTVGSTESLKHLGPFHVKHHRAAHRDRPGGRSIRRRTRPALKPARLILHPSPRNDWRSTSPWRVATAYTATSLHVRR